MGFLITIGLFIASVVIGQLLRPKPKFNTPQPSPAGEITFPTASEDRNVPIIWGTVYQRAPNVLWYGEVDPQAFEHDGVQGYRYYLTVAWGIGQGRIDSIEVYFDDRLVKDGITLAAGGTVVTIDRDDLYGGARGEGGVTGPMAIYGGDALQVADPYLANLLGPTTPGWRGQVYAVSRKMYLGTSPYIKAPQFKMKRTFFANALGVAGGRYEVNNGDLNPICALYELLTDNVWGCGISPGLIDLTNFRASADTVHAEGLGLSMLVDKEMVAKDLAEEILKLVDGVCRQNPGTGLFEVKLARFDYSVPALPIFDHPRIHDVEFSRLAWEETSNLIRVRFIDRENDFKEKLSAPAMDLANVQIRGGQVVAETIDYMGCSTAAMAQVLAAKDLITRTFPMAIVRFKVNREAWDLLQGDVFRFQYGPLGIAVMVMRVTNVAGGTLQDGDITIDAVEDIFAVAWTAYGPSGPPGWDPPEDQLPQPLLAQRLMDAPYGLVVRDERTTHVLVLAVRDAGLHSSYQVWSHPYDALPATPEQYEHTNDEALFTPSGLLVDAFDERDVASIDIEIGPDIARLRSLSFGNFAAGKGLLVVGDEIIAWQTIVDNLDGTVTIAAPDGPGDKLVRGSLDTVPEPHTPGQRVFFLDGYGLTEEAGYPDGGHSGLIDWKAVRAKVLTVNLAGVLDIGDATGMLLLLTTSGSSTDLRVRRPFIVRDIAQNGIKYPESIVGEVTITWQFRNRLDIQRYDLGGATPALEPDTVIDLEWYGEDNDLVRSQTGLTVDEVTYDLADEIAESGLGRPNQRMRNFVKVRNTVNGYESIRTYNPGFYDCSGYGMLYGEYYGGGNG